MSVVIITLDTTRADALGAYGQRLPSSPRIDAMAAGGTLFEQVVASAPSTLPSHATLFTGRQPYSHGVRSNFGYRLSDENVTLAEMLRDRGYATHAEIASSVLRGATRLDQGFEVYREVQTSKPTLRSLEQAQVRLAHARRRGHHRTRPRVPARERGAALPALAPLLRRARASRSAGALPQRDRREPLPRRGAPDGSPGGPRARRARSAGAARAQPGRADGRPRGGAGAARGGDPFLPGLRLDDAGAPGLLGRRRDPARPARGLAGPPRRRDAHAPRPPGARASAGRAGRLAAAAAREPRRRARASRLRRVDRAAPDLRGRRAALRAAGEVEVHPQARAGALRRGLGPARAPQPRGGAAGAGGAAEGAPRAAPRSGAGQPRRRGGRDGPGDAGPAPGPRLRGWRRLGRPRRRAGDARALGPRSHQPARGPPAPAHAPGARSASSATRAPRSCSAPSGAAIPRTAGSSRGSSPR